MDNADVAIKAIRSGLGSLMALQFSAEGGTEHTGWGVCPECYGADWRGHDKNCSLVKVIKEMQAALDVLEPAGKEAAPTK